MAVQDKTNVKLVNPFEFTEAQSTGKGLPYSELVRAYTEMLKQSGDTTKLKEFGAKSSLGQAMELYENLDPTASGGEFKESNKLARSAIANIRQLNPLKTERYFVVPEAADDTVSFDILNREPFALEGPKGQRQLVSSTKKELGDRIEALKSMYKKDIDLQKLKEKQGTDFISDETMDKIIRAKEAYGDKFNDDSLMANLPFSGSMPINPEGLQWHEDPPAEKYKNDILRDRENYNFPENVISPEDSTKAVEKLKNKQEYQRSGPHLIDMGLKFTPLSPIAVAAEQGEPFSRGVAGAIPSLAGTVGGVFISPFASPAVGAGIAGAANAFGDEIARGERPDELTGLETISSYAVPTVIGGTVGAATAGLGERAASKLRKKALNADYNKAKEARDAAEAELENMNRNTLNGETYDYNKSNKTDADKEAEEATKRVMDAASKDISKVSTGDLDNVILNPERVERLREAMAMQNRAIENEETRTALLKRLNKDTEFNSIVREVLGPNTVDAKYTVDGFDDLVRLTGGNERNIITPDIWNKTADIKNVPEHASEVIASRPIRGNLQVPETVEQTVYGARGYDPMGKGALMDTDPQIASKNKWLKSDDIVNAIKKNALDLDPTGAKQLEDSFVAQYGSDDLGFARSVSNHLGAIVGEAAEGILKRDMTGDRLNDLASEYVSWMLPPNGTREAEEYLKNMFLFRVKSALNTGLKDGQLEPGFSYEKGRSSVADVLNRGLDVLRLARNTDRGMGASNLTADKLGRLSFNQLRDMYRKNDGTPVSSEEFLNIMTAALQQTPAKVNAGVINPEMAYGYLGGLERPSEEAMKVFARKKDRTHYLRTIQPKLREVLSRADATTKAQVEAQKDLVNSLKETERASAQRLSEPLSNKTKRFASLLGYYPGSTAASRYSNFGLTKPEQATQREEYATDKPAQYSYEKLKSIPWYGKIFPPKVTEAKQRGNFVPNRFVYPFQK